MSAGDRDTLAALLAEHYPIRDEGTEQVVCWCLWKPETRLYGFAEWDAVRAHVADVLLGSGWLAEREAAAEQRGREDNADHGMCYVHGSKALAGVQAEAWDEGRDVGHEDTYLNLIEGRGDFDAAETPNPYRTTEDTD